MGIVSRVIAALRSGAPVTDADLESADRRAFMKLGMAVTASGLLLPVPVVSVPKPEIVVVTAGARFFYVHNDGRDGAYRSLQEAYGHMSPGDTAFLIAGHREKIATVSLRPDGATIVGLGNGGPRVLITSPRTQDVRG